jgi:hypothetical protein
MNAPSALDPAILEKIEAFARRRRRLLWARGACALGAVLAAAMTAAALVDWLVLLPDGARAALSAAAYAAALAAGWFAAGRFLWRRPDARVLARFIEQLRPELREDLLSAVELGDPGTPRLRGRSNHGSGEAEAWAVPSTAFLEALQRDVAERLRDVEAAAVLPWRRIAPWAWAAAGALGVVGALLLVPGFRYERRLLRSLLPLANLERLSRVRVTILEPRPPEGGVPQGDAVAVRVELSGPDPRGVELEIFPESGRPERVEMRPLGGRRFEASVLVGRAPVVYRVRAGDAITRKFTLTPLPRPEVVAFRKTFVYPAYAGKPPRRAGPEPAGDLVELEGTAVELEVEVNQEVQTAELRLEQGGVSATLPLRPADDPRRLKASLTLSASGTYRVHLIAASTGFENKFSPQYEIRAQPDLVPRVSIEDPTQDLLVPPDEVVVLRGLAQDDLGLRRVAQAVRVNQGEWREITIAEDAGPRYAVSHRWDLYELGVQPGDRVTTKLVAVDLKGHRAESAPLHVSVSAPGFDPHRLLPLAAKEGVYAALVELRDAARLRDGEAGAPAAEPRPEEELARRQVAQEADVTESRAKEALRLARSTREADALDGTARLVRRLREGALAEGAASAAFAEERYRDILAGEEALAILADLRDLAREQEALRRQTLAARAAQDPKAWERLARRQGVAASQVKAVEDILAVLVLRAPQGVARRVSALRQQLEEARAGLRKALEAPPAPALEAPSEAMRQAVARALEEFAGLERELARRARAAHGELARRAEASHADVRAAAEALPAEGESLRRARAAQALLSARAAVEESRRDADSFFAADAALAARALGAVLDAQAVSPEPGRLRGALVTIERAFRALETGHRVSEIASGLRELAEGERWQAASVAAAVRHPKDWLWLEDRVRGLEAELRGAGFPEEVARDFQKAWRGPAGDAVRREMAERAAPERKAAPAAVAPPLETLVAEAGRARARLEPFLEAARRELRALVPTLPQRMEELAQAAERLRGKTEDLAGRAETADPSAEARNLLADQERLNRQVEEVVAELRRDANVQDLFTPEGRERARDADGAMAMLRQAPGKAEEFLDRAARAGAQARAEALAGAAEEQGKLARALRTVAGHYRNLEAGRPEETRPELRKAEEALGVKGELDARYAQMARLAALARLRDGEAGAPAAEDSAEAKALREALEGALASDEAMRRELAQLARGSLEGAEEALGEAAAREREAAKDLESAQGVAGAAAGARGIAEEARRLARQEAPRIAAALAQAGLRPAEALVEAQKRLEEAAGRVPAEGASSGEAARGLEAAAGLLERASADLRGVERAAGQEVPAAASARAAAEGAARARGRADEARRAAEREAKEAGAAEEAAARARREARAAEEAAAGKPGDAAAAAKAKEASERARAAEGEARRQAGEAEAARREADRRAREAQEAAEEAGRAAREAEAAARQAQGAREGAARAAERAAALAGRARAMAQAAEARAQAMGRAAARHAEAEALVREAQAGVEQAARGAAALGRPEEAHTLEQVARGIEQVARHEVARARETARGADPGPARQAAEEARRAIEAQAEALAQARRASPPPEGGAAEVPPGGLSEAAAQLLARALHALNAPSAPPGEGPAAEAARAVAGAAAAQARATVRARAEGQGGGGEPGDAPFGRTPGAGRGASVEGGEAGEAALPRALRRLGGDWGRLRALQAENILEARREAVPAEYRDMVETYFRVLSERARERK